MIYNRLQSGLPLLLLICLFGLPEGSPLKVMPLSVGNTWKYEYSCDTLSENNDVVNKRSGRNGEITLQITDLQQLNGNHAFTVLCQDRGNSWTYSDTTDTVSDDYTNSFSLTLAKTHDSVYSPSNDLGMCSIFVYFLLKRDTSYTHNNQGTTITSVSVDISTDTGSVSINGNSRTLYFQNEKFVNQTFGMSVSGLLETTLYDSTQWIERTGLKRKYHCKTVRHHHTRSFQRYTEIYTLIDMNVQTVRRDKRSSIPPRLSKQQFNLFDMQGRAVTSRNLCKGMYITKLSQSGRCQPLLRVTSPRENIAN